MSLSVEPMKKVQILLRAGTSQDTYSFTPEPVEYDFIYGVGSTGLTPFELALSDRYQGDVIHLSVSSGEAQQFFGTFLGEVTSRTHIAILPAQTFFEVTVGGIVDADNSEVVKALANSLKNGCGCGGSCGC